MDEQPILICYDDSTWARAAIAAAAALLGPRRAIVLDLAPLVTVAESLAFFTPAPGDFLALNRDDALVHAEKGAALAREVGFAAEARADVGAPTYEGILEVANEIGAAAIVIGSRGLTGGREVLWGSLSHQVAEYAGRPVLIVPPAHAEAHAS